MNNLKRWLFEVGTALYSNIHRYALFHWFWELWANLACWFAFSLCDLMQVVYDKKREMEKKNLDWLEGRR